MYKQYLFYFLMSLGLFQAQNIQGQNYQIALPDLEVLDALVAAHLVDTTTNMPFSNSPYAVSGATTNISQNALVSHGIHLVTGTYASTTCWRIARLELSGRSQVLAGSSYPTNAILASSLLDLFDNNPDKLDSLQYLDLSANGLIGSFQWWGATSLFNVPTKFTLNISNNWLDQNEVREWLINFSPDTIYADNFTGIKPIPGASARHIGDTDASNLLNLAGSFGAANPVYIDISNTYFTDSFFIASGTATIQDLENFAQRNPMRLDFKDFEANFSAAGHSIPRLKYFKCTNCNIKQIDSLPTFSNLEVLQLDSNRIDSIRIPTMSSPNTYPSFGLGSLKILNLSHNNLSGNFPLHWFFGAATGSISRPIQKIYLQHNQLTGIDQTVLEQRMGNTPFLVPSSYLVSAGTTPVLSSVTASAATISTNALTTVRLDHNKFDFADLYAFNISMGLQISPMGSPAPLINMPVDTVRGSNYQNIPASQTSAVYYHPQDSLGMGGVRRRAVGERTRFELASSDPLLDFSAAVRQSLLSIAPYSSTIQRNGYTWYQLDSSTAANRRDLVIFTPNTLGQRDRGSVTLPNGIAPSVGVTPVEIGNTPPVGINVERFAGAYFESLNPLLERSKIGINTINANFPALQLHAKHKTVMTGGCVDNLGRAVRCQEISVQYDTAYINQNRGTRSVEEFKKALRDTAGAYVLETCVCGNAELWALYDTTQMNLHLLANQANYGSQTATTASMTRRPGLKSADMNYVIVPNMTQNLNVPNDSAAYANASTQKQRTLIAHLDSGVDYDHRDLMRYLRKNPSDLKNDTLDNDANGVVNDFIGYNFFDRNSQPSDDLGHGTQIAGILAGLSSPSVHATGVNLVYDTVDILPIRFTNFRNEGTSYNAACGIYYAAEYHRLHNLQTGERTGIDTSKSPVRVINASWGYQGETCKLLYDAIKYAGDECNILFVTAAGNDNRTDIDLVPFYPANYKLKNVLVVGSVDNNLNALSAYSNLGSSNVDIAALGTIRSTTTIDGYITASIQGTSFSTPMVARAAGILFNKYPNASADAVKTALLASAQRINGHDSVYIRSKGVLNLDAAFVYLDTLSQSQRIACDTNRTDSTFVNHHVGVVITDPKTELNIYPNPIQDQVNITLESASSEMVDIRILDAQGQVLIQKSFAPNTQNFELSTESLAQGFYLLHIYQGSQQWAAKLIKL